jgi:hypothetical protein
MVKINMCRTRCTLFYFLGDIKGFVFQHNSEVYKFMQLSIFLIDFRWDL